jgi:hypothetical protein
MFIHGLPLQHVVDTPAIHILYIVFEGSDPEKNLIRRSYAFIMNGLDQKNVHFA